MRLSKPALSMVPKHHDNLKVVLVGNYAIDAQYSMLYFSKVLHQELNKRNISADLLAPQPSFGKLFRTPRGLGKWLGYIDKLILFPIQLNQYLQKFKEPALLHICDHSNSFYCKASTNRLTLLTCHDLIAVGNALGWYPEHRTRWTGRQLQRHIARGFSYADFIICDSVATRNDFLRLRNISSECISVIYQGLNYDYRPIPSAEAASHIKCLSPQSYVTLTDIPNWIDNFILHVGSNNWYKNRLRLLQAYKLLKTENELLPYLVIAGKPLIQEHRKFINESGLASNVICLSNLKQEDLNALYCLARLMVFPSLIEGFGLPVIEAQSCDCPVVTSRRASLAEVSGEACIFCNPDDPKDIAQAIDKVLLMTKDALAHLITKGRQNASKFSTQKMIDEYMALYQKLWMKTVNLDNVY